MKRIVSIFALAFLFISCAHHRDVRPGEDGVHKVIVNVESKDQGPGLAMPQADHYCEKLGKSPVYLDEKVNYQGSMTEENYNKTKSIGNVASAVGTAGYIFGGEKESSAGGLVALGGVAAKAATGLGYKFEMRFKCK